MNYTSSGYMRLLDEQEFHHHFFRNFKSPALAPEDPLQPAAGMLWMQTRLGIGVEVRLCSLEHQIIVTEIDHPAPADWPSTAMFLFAEVLFKTKDFKGFLAVMHGHPAAADMLLAVQLRSGSRTIEEAKDMVRASYAARAARAALSEVSR